ncbi:hypothetical protein DRP77_06630 [Candidatus Poribacteria bacterium]|nr:MAG: hypothetical protein DRP77_06630 [Candidatus Poribacteria bacterium]
MKNVRGQELINAIRAVYEGESVLHPAVAEKLLRRLQSSARGNGEPSRRQLLSKRELEVVRLGAQGLVNKEIANKLSLSERTVQTHWRNIFAKLGVSSRIEAITYCLRKGWISLEGDEGRSEAR